MARSHRVTRDGLAALVVVVVVRTDVVTSGFGAGAFAIVVFVGTEGLGAGARMKICVSTVLVDAMSNRTPQIALKVTLCWLSNSTSGAVQRYVSEDVFVAEQRHSLAFSLRQSTKH